MKYDFFGYATKNNVRCSDGRIIRQDAFRGNDGGTVPLVWQHIHDDPTKVIGHADLENRPDGVYAKCSLNDSDMGKHVKTIVKHGDVSSLSIFANQLVQQGNDVVHGVIRELSVVLAGANPGACILNESIHHSDGYDEILEDQAKIFFDQPLIMQQDVEHSAIDNAGIAIEHADNEDEKEKEDMANQNGSQNEGSDEKTVEDVWNSLTDEQKNVVYYMIGELVEGENADLDELEEDEEAMKHSVFMDSEAKDEYLAHSEEMMAAFVEARDNSTSLKQTFIKHGIENIDILFPEAKSVTPTPDMITRQMDWVDKVWSAIKKSPFARIKSVAADLTEDDARAKGYIKGKEKVEEQFSLLKRITTPQTVYKKQALDRDDIIDITDFDAVAWLKLEMRMMLNEELSRAVLVGDGRLASSNDKIKPDNIRPIYYDDDMYTIHWTAEIPANADATDKSNAIVDSFLRARKNYKGSGSPTLYASVDVINDMLLARDKMGRRMYATMTELADALRVKEIVEVPVFEGITRTDSDSNKFELLGIVVNLNDYTVGADRGGEVSFFDHFDIDFNKEKYLIETRCSGALTHPYSAIAVELPVSKPSSGGATDQQTTVG